MNANLLKSTICILLVSSLCSQATVNNPNTDWFRDAQYGVFMHLLPGDAKGLALVQEFDVEGLARQLETLGAKYFVITLGQNSGFFNAPNATYDRYTGYAPGARCSTRDLPLDLHRVLQPRGIRLMLYLPCQTPNQDARAQKAFGLAEGKRDQPIDLEFARKWARVIQEWSGRYGDKVAGWWFDGGYERVRFNEEMAQVYAQAAKHGNPSALVTFNPGVRLIRHTQAEDYTAGELNEPFNVLPTSRWVDGSQWHALTYLGSRWSARDTRYPAEKWVQWVRAVVAREGVVTLDMGPNWDPQAGPIGALAEAQMEQVRAVRTALNEGSGDRANPSRAAVELRARGGLPNFFAKAQILSRNGNKIDDPARYEPRRWYAGALLIDGELKSPPASDGQEKMPKRLKRAESFLGIHYDFHAGKDCNEIGKNTTRAMIENILRQVHPDYIQIDCKGHPGLSSYPTKVGHQAPGFAGDALKLWRQVTAEHGVALYMHYSGVWDAEAIRRHPEWGAVNADGKTNERATSRFGPYADTLLIPQLRELAGAYGVDGVWVDGDCWASVPDYSAPALQAFRRATGLETAPRKPGEPHWFEFLQFHREAFRQYLRHYIAEVKKTHPDFQLCSNWAFTDHMPEPVSVPVDFLSGDYAPDDSVNSARLSGRYLTRQGVPWDLMAWSFSRNKTADGRNQKTAVQLQREAAVVLALGGGFQAYFKQKRDGSVYDERVPVMAEVAKFCRARQELCHHATQVPQVALLFSTAAHYRKINGLFSRDLARMSGALQALLQSQYSVELLGEHHLTGRLAEYPLIVIPEWEYLEPAFKDELTAYVKAGGNLLLIGPKTAALFQAELDAVRSDDVRRSLQAPDGQPPATIAEFGQGKIAAVPFAFGQRYATAPTDASRQFLNDLVRQLFPQPMVEVKGSTDVDVVINRLRDNRLAVNLVNTAGPHRQEPILDSIPPVGPLAVTIRQVAKPTRITLQPAGLALSFEHRDGETHFAVPRVDIHEVIVVETK